MLAECKLLYIAKFFLVKKAESLAAGEVYGQMGEYHWRDGLPKTGCESAPKRCFSRVYVVEIAKLGCLDDAGLIT
jgi:hypothetical protein